METGADANITANANADAQEGVAPPRFGTLPVDLFVLENWDYSAPVENDATQWDKVVMQYLSLTPKERFPYHQASFELEDNPSDEWVDEGPLVHFVQRKIDRVLVGRLTERERKVNGSIPSTSGPPTLWIRTCFDSALEQQYDDLAGRAVLGNGYSVETEMILEDEDRYGNLENADSDAFITTIVTRFPCLCDAQRGSIIDDYDFMAIPEDGDETPLELASKRVCAVLYVIDKEALEEDLIKVLWLSAHGGCLWRNKISPDEMLDLSGNLMGAGTLEEAVGAYCTEGGPGSGLILEREDGGEGDIFFGQDA